MPDELRIAPGLSLPLDAVTETFLILGKRGSGKTSTATVLTEQMIGAGLPVCVIDPTGAWWGLRSSADGTGPGLPVTILGGEHADLPLAPESGAPVADLLVSERVPLVLDLALMSKTQQRRFVLDFLERVYRANRDPLHLVVDEADLFCMSADTEVLTPEGWARWDQIRVGKEVVAFSPETGEYRNEPIQRLLLREHDGEMVRLKTKGLDQLVTPDHRVVLRRIQRAKGRAAKVYDWTFCQAAEVPTCIQVPLGGAPAGRGVEIDDALLQVLGWLITDGYVNSQPGRQQLYGIEQSYRSVKCGRSMVAAMGAVLDSMPGVGRYERAARTSATRDGGTTEHGPSAVWWFREEASQKIAKWIGDDTHRIPRQILEEGSPAQLGILMQALLEGDGTSVNGVWTSFYPGNNEGLADDFQEIATRLGVSTAKLWVPSIGQWQVTVSRREHHHLRRPAREPYKGLVWDITVPSGAFVARRNGRVFVTGNCPMRATGEIARLIGAYEDMVRRGRIHGIGSTSITQRPAGMHTDIRSQAEVLIALRLIGKHDVAALDDWVRLHATDEEARELKASLPSLPVGTAWVWSPGWLEVLKRVSVFPRTTFDSSATPKVGQARIVPREFARVDAADLDRMGARLAVPAGPAEPPAKRAADPDAGRLQAQVTALRGQLAEALAREPERVEVPVLQPGEAAMVEQAITALRDMAGALEISLSRAAAGAQRPAAVVAHVPAPLAARLAAAAPPASPAAPATSQPPGGSPPLGKAQRIILAVLAQFPEGRTKIQLSLLSGYSVKSSGFGNTLGALRSAGLINRGNPIQITPEGLAAIGDGWEPLPSGDALAEHWMGQLGKAERAILRYLLDSWPQTRTREEVSAATGYSQTSSGFGNALGRLRSLELINRGADMAADETFAREVRQDA